MKQSFFKKYLSPPAPAEITDPITRARINILFYMMMVSILFCLILTVIYIVQGPPLQLVRILVVLLTLIYGQRKLILFHSYHPAAHIVLSILNMLVWTNIFVVSLAISIVTVQYILLTITVSFYLLNVRWGIFYSLVSMLPVFVFFTFNGIKDALPFVSGQEVSEPIFISVMMVNFFQLIFVHYHFLKGFHLAIFQLREAQEDEKELNIQLKEAIKMAENSSKAKSDFLSTMSHELRTPLNSVIGMSYVLLADNPRDDLADNVKVLHFSAESLLALINDILDFNKLEYGKIEMEHIDFSPSELIERIYTGLKYQSDEKGLSFKLNKDEGLKDIVVVGDPTRLSQILFNLLGNAIKFTSDGGIELSVGIENQDSKSVLLDFSIKDTGIGISEEQRTIIFEPFSQGSNSITRRFGGSGLGLAITKQLLDLHESRIELNSEQGVGTTFKFQIRYKRVSAKEVQLDTNPSAYLNEQTDISKLAVLVAEDNAMNVLLMKKLFSSWSVQADYAENGAEALEKAKLKRYDVILMDIHMPIMDGYTSTKEILSFYKGSPQSPWIIAITASVATDVQNKIAKAGLHDYISKPFNPLELKRKLLNFSVKLKPAEY